MTETIAIPPDERGTVRLFALDLPPEEARAFVADPGAVARALGAPDLDPSRIDVFPVSRIAALGLPAYLAEGHGIPPEALAPDAARLAALDGHVAVIAAGAFGPKARTLSVAPPLRLVGHWQEDAAPVAFGSLPSRGAEGTLGAPAPPPPAPRAGGGKRWLLAILILVLAILGFIILIGGR
jgi:hypothetical protein